ncbi:hypothetical protein D3C80_1677730 [compost metagenome]
MQAGFFTGVAGVTDGVPDGVGHLLVLQHELGYAFFPAVGHLGTGLEVGVGQRFIKAQTAEPDATAGVVDVAGTGVRRYRHDATLSTVLAVDHAQVPVADFGGYTDCTSGTVQDRQGIALDDYLVDGLDRDIFKHV